MNISTMNTSTMNYSIMNYSTMNYSTMNNLAGPENEIPSSHSSVVVYDRNGVCGRLAYVEFERWLLKSILTEEQLQQGNYPRPHQITEGKAILCNLPHRFIRVIPDEKKRTCAFCNTSYDVDNKGMEINNAKECVYHLYSTPPSPYTYKCCGREGDATGCSKRDFHCTSDVDSNNLNNFMYTNTFSGSKLAIYALDCEFVYTTVGLELAAITIIDHNEKIVLDTCVKPDNEILDYVPQFSRLSADNFKENCITTDEYRNKMRELLNPNVILIGHSVREDFLRMGLVHDKVVDTTTLYPRPDGVNGVLLASLKKLSKQYLGFMTFPDTASKAFVDSVLTLRLVKLAAWRRRHYT